MSTNMPTFKLGYCDSGKKPGDIETYLSKYHEGAMSSKKFRGEKNDHWLSLIEKENQHINNLQSQLRNFGFYPEGEIDGIFGYRTFSASRLFQEYVRNVEGNFGIGKPDGIVGSKTHEHLQRWEKQGKQADWINFSSQNTIPEYKYWQQVLQLYQTINLQQPVDTVLDMVNGFSNKTDTLKVSEWRYHPDDIHLIGIRRHEWRRTNVRENDDIFILLLNGTVFKFFGSTDPSPKIADREDEAYLVRGQHCYRFGWHKLSSLYKVYRALRPLESGVLICRDSDTDNAFTREDLNVGISRNTTINIHWSGSGRSNWSAGCQVIAGSRYINHLNTKVDCLDYASVGYSGLSNKTRGAYNVLLDLMTVFAPDISLSDGTLIHYTLLYERDLNIISSSGKPITTAALEELTNLNADEILQVKQYVALGSLVDKLVQNN